MLTLALTIFLVTCAFLMFPRITITVSAFAVAGPVIGVLVAIIMIWTL